MQERGDLLQQGGYDAPVYGKIQEHKGNYKKHYLVLALTLVLTLDLAQIIKLPLLNYFCSLLNFDRFAYFYRSLLLPKTIKDQ